MEQYKGFYTKRTGAPYTQIDYWPTKWISHGQNIQAPYVAAYRLKFSLGDDRCIKAFVSADERYQLFLDGKRIGRGSERGDKNNWFYETYDISFEKGEHILVAVVWSLGPLAPWAQQTVYHGFLFSPEYDNDILLMGTGVAKWETKILPGYSFIPPKDTIGYGGGCGCSERIDANKFDWDYQKGQTEGWSPVSTHFSGNNGKVRKPTANLHKLKTGMLKNMLETKINCGTVRHVSVTKFEDTRFEPVGESLDTSDWSSFINKKKFIFPKNKKERIIIDLENYYCCYPILTVSKGKGAKISLSWAESLFLNPELSDQNNKGNRDEITGKYFKGLCDTYILDGGFMRTFEPLWWRAGRYVQLTVESGDEEVIFENFGIVETRYPLFMESEYVSDNDKMNSLIPTAIRTLQMCSHETYMDCPYYEQLMYAGDTRVEVLTTYAITRDFSLPQKAIAMFNAAREDYEGLNSCAYPDMESKVIPSFSLWWIGMVYDYALYGGDMSFVGEMMCGVRAVMETILSHKNENGLIVSPNGWDYIDWSQNSANKWHYGIAPDEGTNINSIFNFQTAYILRLMSLLESHLGENELSERYARLSKEISDITAKTFWDEKRKIFTDDIFKKNGSEHAQCMAILCGNLDKETEDQVFEGLITDMDLARTSIFYSHYLFEVFKKKNRVDLLEQKLSKWYELLDYGYKTLPEYLSLVTRSDCHAWSVHPIYHYFSTFLGIRPNAIGFDEIEICPQLGSLKYAKAKMIHKNGDIFVEFKIENNVFYASIKLPKNTTGTFIYKDKVFELSENNNILIT